jgi:UDP-N-acetylglucosamine 1-carboxyvinyltransferase
MDKFIIEGGERLKGKVRISGSKNAVLPALAATLLQRGKYSIGNVPRLMDVTTMMQLLDLLGARCVWRDEHTIDIDTTAVENHVAPYELVKKMRASVLALGALIGGLRKATVSSPGGCAIGERPIDLHLKGLSALGCDVAIREGYVDVTAKKLKGARIVFDSVTVGGTENLLMAAVFAKGETLIENAAANRKWSILRGCSRRWGRASKGKGQRSYG